MTAFVANTNNLDLIGLKNAATGQFINDANVTVTVKDAAGVEVSGETWPIPMDYVVASNGNYRGVMSHTIALLPGKTYTAEISVDADESIAFWAYDFRAINRKD